MQRSFKKITNSRKPSTFSSGATYDENEMELLEGSNCSEKRYSLLIFFTPLLASGLSVMRRVSAGTEKSFWNSFTRYLFWYGYSFLISTSPTMVLVVVEFVFGCTTSNQPLSSFAVRESRQTSLIQFSTAMELSLQNFSVSFS